MRQNYVLLKQESVVAALKRKKAEALKVKQWEQRLKQKQAARPALIASLPETAFLEDVSTLYRLDEADDQARTGFADLDAEATTNTLMGPATTAPSSSSSYKVVPGALVIGKKRHQPKENSRDANESLLNSVVADAPFQKIRAKNRKVAPPVRRVPTEVMVPDNDDDDDIGLEPMEVAEYEFDEEYE